jgi:cytoskeleton protein RodZ
MNHSDRQGDAELASKNIDFGSILSGARRARNYSIEEVSESLKIPVQTISALENNAIEQLPAPTFTQGYIRAYARFLEISEDSIIEKYNHAVPHEPSSDLKPRSNLPDEASSQSPLIKFITLLLIFSGIAAIIFGSFQYYQKKADDIESSLENQPQSFTGNSLNSPGEQNLSIQQGPQSDKASDLQQDTTITESTVIETDENIADSSEPLTEVSSTEAILEAGNNEPANNEASNEVENKSDIIEFYAEKGSWLKVYDANDTRLFYNMLKPGKSKVLEGKAPFRITMGNAGSTRVVLNDLVVDTSNYIRGNNTAIFSISTEDETTVFH